MDMCMCLENDGATMRRTAAVLGQQGPAAAGTNAVGRRNNIHGSNLQSDPLRLGPSTAHSRGPSVSRRSFLSRAAVAGAGLCLPAILHARDDSPATPRPKAQIAIS